MSKIDDIEKLLSEKTTNVETTINKTKKNEPIINEETTFSDKDKYKHVKKTLQDFKDKKIGLTRREKKMITNMEFDSVKKTQGITIGLAVVGLMFLMLIRDYLPNDAYFTIIVLVGTVMFLPVGMIAGWVIFDPVMRCKILRKVSKTNYGIVNFVGKGKRIVSKIKNFDNGLIWQKDLCWVLTRDKVYQITKDGNAVNDGNKLDPDSVVTLVDTVPVIFVDMDSMEPLSIFQKGRTPVYPSEIGPSCKSWMDIQKAKQLSHRKQTDYLLLGAVVGAVGALVISLIVLNKIEEMTEMLKAIQNSLAQTPP